MIKIETCKFSDVKDVYGLICELEETEFDFKTFEIVFQNKIENQKNHCILAKNDNLIIGLLNLNIDFQLHHNSKVATIEELIVKRDFRGRRIGKTLIDNAIQHAKNNNCELIELTSSFSRKQAHNFYIKNGFEKTSYKFKLNL